MKNNLLIPSCITVSICYILGSTFYVVFDETSFLIQLTLKVIGALVAYITIIIFQCKNSKSYRKSIMNLFNIGFAFVLFGDFFLAYANKDVPTKEVFFPLGMAAYLIGYSLFGIAGILYYISDIIVGLNEFSTIRDFALLEFLLFIPYVAGHIYMLMGIYKYTQKQ